MREQNEANEKVKETYYRHVFTTKFNLSNKPPKTDTCATCDWFHAAISEANDATEKAESERKLKVHKDEAEAGQNLMREMSQDNDEETRVICLDLQQTQPLPRLSTSVTYYRRKMWLYNLCIHDMKRNKSKFYVWDEVTGGRGSVEVVSCLGQWISDEYAANAFEKLVIFSDNCGGQNKNINFIMFLLRELHSSRLSSIVHYYLVPGHSYMACDRAFGNIEKKYQKHGDVYDKATYCDIIKDTIHGGYEVIEMQQANFLDVGGLQKYIVHRKPKAPYNFAKARRFEFQLNYREGYLLGMGYASPLGHVRLMPGTANYRPSKFNLNQVVLGPKYPTPPLMKMGKITDVEALLPYIPPIKSAYLKGIIAVQKALHQAQSTATAAPRPAPARPSRATDSNSDDDPDDPNAFMDYDTEESQ